MTCILRKLSRVRLSDVPRPTKRCGAGACALAVATLLAACGGGGGSGSPALTAQTITFSQPGNLVVGASEALTASASSSLTVSFNTSSAASICTVSGTTVLAVGAGTCTLVASQAGNATFGAATPVSQSITIMPAGRTQTISFPAPANLVAGGSEALTASADSGLTVSFSTSSAASICTVSGSTVQAVAAGTCTVIASQAGNATYSAATPVAQSITISAASASTPFFLTGASGTASNGYALTAVNPSTGTKNSIASGGAWTNQAAIAQWTPSGGTATNAGIRYRVFADANNALEVSDLSLGGTGPTATQLSNVSTTIFCGASATSAPNAPTVLNDFVNPQNSLLVYRTASTCPTTADLFTVIPLSAGPTTAPAPASLVEPVDVVRDATGAITDLLVLVHSGTASGSSLAIAVGNTLPAQASQLTAIATLSGQGASSAGGDFESLGVVLQPDGSHVWLWRDLGGINAVNLKISGSTVTPSSVSSVYSVQDTDVIQAPAILDGTNAYVALIDTNNPTNKIIRIDTTAIATPAVNILQENTTAGLGIELEGVANANLIYTYTDQSGLRYVAKTVLNQATGTSIWSATAGSGQTLDQVNAPVIVGGSVYFCVTAAATLPQAYFWSGSGTPAALGTNGSQVLGGVSASPLSTANPSTPVYTAAIVATFSSQASATGSGNAYPGAVINSYDAANVATILGTLPSPQNRNLYQSATLSESPLQMGMPALLLLSGYASDPGYSAQDLFQFIPGVANSLNRITTNLQ